MPRLVNATTGVIVNVDDKTAAQLGAAWSDADKPNQPAARSKAPTK